MQKNINKVEYELSPRRMPLRNFGNIVLDIPKNPFFVNINFCYTYRKGFFDNYTYMILTDPYLQKIEWKIRQHTWLPAHYDFVISANTDCGIPCLAIIDDSISNTYSLYYCTIIEGLNLPILVFTNNIAKLYNIKKKYIYNSTCDDDFIDEVVEIVTCENIFDLGNTDYCIPILGIDFNNLVYNISDLYYEFAKYTFKTKNSKEDKVYEYYLPSIFDMHTFIDENLTHKPHLVEDYEITKNTNVNIFYNYLTYVRNMNEQIISPIPYMNNGCHWIFPYYDIFTNSDKSDRICLLTTSRLMYNNHIHRETCATGSNDYIRRFLTNFSLSNIQEINYISWYDGRAMNILNFVRDVYGDEFNRVNDKKDILTKLYRYIIKRFILQDETYRFDFEKDNYSTLSD